MWIRRWMVGLALVAGVAMTIFAGSARAADARPDLTGMWRFDPKHSDTPMFGPGGRGGERGGWGRGGMGGGMGGGGWVPPREGGPREAGGGEPHERPPGGDVSRRPVRYPDLMHVTQTASIVSFEDSSGVVLQEITTIGAVPDTMVHAPGAQVVSGEWKGDRLQVSREGQRGGRITSTYRLEDKGARLVIETKMEGSGDLPSRQFKRVYERVNT